MLILHFKQVFCSHYYFNDKLSVANITLIKKKRVKFFPNSSFK